MQINFLSLPSKKMLPSGDFLKIDVYLDGKWEGCLSHSRARRNTVSEILAHNTPVWIKLGATVVVAPVA